jgi:hypothetical protein
VVQLVKNIVGIYVEQDLVQTYSHAKNRDANETTFFSPMHIQRPVKGEPESKIMKKEIDNDKTINKRVQDYIV